MLKAKVMFLCFSVRMVLRLPVWTVLSLEQGLVILFFDTVLVNKVVYSE